MNEKEIVKEALATIGWTQGTLADALGYVSQSGVGQALSSAKYAGKSMKVDTFVKMLDAMGYELIVVSKNPSVNKNKWKVGYDK